MKLKSLVVAIFLATTSLSMHGIGGFIFDDLSSSRQCVEKENISKLKQPDTEKHELEVDKQKTQNAQLRLSWAQRHPYVLARELL